MRRIPPIFHNSDHVSFSLWNCLQQAEPFHSWHLSATGTKWRLQKGLLLLHNLVFGEHSASCISKLCSEFARLVSELLQVTCWALEATLLQRQVGSISGNNVSLQYSRWKVQFTTYIHCMRGYNFQSFHRNPNEIDPGPDRITLGTEIYKFYELNASIELRSWAPTRTKLEEWLPGHDMSGTCLWHKDQEQSTPRHLEHHQRDLQRISYISQFQCQHASVDCCPYPLQSLHRVPFAKQNCFWNMLLLEYFVCLNSNLFAIFSSFKDLEGLGGAYCCDHFTSQCRMFFKFNEIQSTELHRYSDWL